MPADAAASRIGGGIRRLIAPFERSHEREFLPAALEVVETPPSPTGRLMSWLIIGFFLLALLWAALGRVDVIATAPGRVRPVGDVKLIQPLDTGVIRRIRVGDGQLVRAGDVLIELDPTQAAADRDRDRLDLILAELDVARLTAIKNGKRDFPAPPDAPPIEVARARATMRAELADLAAQVGDLNGQISAKTAEAGQAEAESAKLGASLPIIERRMAIRQEIMRLGYGSRLQTLDTQQQLSEAQHDVNVLDEHRAQVASARTALQRQRDDAVARFNLSIFDQLAKAQERLNQLTQDLRKTEQRTRQTELRAPVDGIVEGLTVHTVGGVVTPAQRLMTIVPETRGVTVEVKLANRDVGFVRPGQDVKIKVETFAFTRYGLLDGRVLGISHDAIPHPERTPEAQVANSPSDDLSPAYTARVSLAQASMLVDGDRVPLQPGMAVTAEIRIGRRSVLSYILSPLARRSSESLHER